MSSGSWLSLSGIAAIAAALFTGSCSSGGGGAGVGTASKDGGTGSSGSSSGGPGADATVGCTTDMDCAASVPPTVAAPGVGPSCAAGKCNALQGVCEYVAKDEDGDGHPAANCTSTNGVIIQEGDDCNDQDPNLYPGHPEACQLVPDGGVDSGAYCTTGLLSCRSDGSEAPCTSICTACEPGAPGCAGAQPQLCNPMGTAWTNTTSSPCAGAAPVCLIVNSNAACVACSPGTTQCTSNGVSTCSATAVWGTPATCTNQTCVVSSGTATCTGVCAPTQTNPVSCGNCGTGTDTQTCGASGAFVTSGSCPGQGVCAPNATQSCNSYGTQTCSGTCGWGACSCASTPVCTPNATQCAATDGVQTCSACGQWGSAVACSGSTPFCVGSACAANPPSCQTSGAGLTNCGSASESCCTSPEVTPNGTYYRTYTNSGSGPTGEADLATVSGFRMDKYLVTVGRFRQFVAAWNGGSGWTPPAGSGKHTHLNAGSGLNATGGGYEPGWITSDNSNIAPTNANLACEPPYATWTNTAGSQENLPINCVNWYESYAFCIWDGGFLPSEAEWEYAAAGGSQQREYPWGTAAAGTACPGTGCQYAIYNCDYPSGSGSCTGVGNIAPVGYAASGAGLWGQLDLGGNMSEWNLDWYASYVDPCTDCANFTAASDRVIRSGSFPFGNFQILLPVSRFDDTPTTRNSEGFGLRCSRTP
jgi:sulfatase modifying factor 1